MEFYSTSARILDVILSAPGPQPLRELCERALSKSAADSGKPSTWSRGNDGRASSGSRPLSATRCYALLAETLKYLPTLEKLLDGTDLLVKESKVLGRKTSPSPRSLVLVLMHDLLFAKRGIALPREHKVRQAVEGYALRFRAGLQREKIRKAVTTDEGLQVDVQEYVRTDLHQASGDHAGSKGKSKAEKLGLDGKIRWLRINEASWNTTEAVDWLEQNGWKEVATLDELASTTGRCFCRDPHIPNLLAFPLHSLNLPKFPPYQDARVIAQDKASCMPAFLLVQDLVSNPTSEGVTVIDATSAPGNKTSYVALALSAHLPAQSAVLAFERDSNRFVTLQKMMRRAGCDNVQGFHMDFLSVDPTEEPYSEASHILVDPSCSGSGIHDDRDANADEVQARLKPLSQFQRHILSHALEFPNARKVVYSTCSIHAEENEEVVFDVLDKKAHRGRWSVQSRKETLPDWPIRGSDPDGRWSDRKAEVEGMIRCERRLGTHGFFVAVLTRNDGNTVADAAGGDSEMQDSHPAEQTDRRVSPSVQRQRRKSLSSEKGADWVLARPTFSLLRMATLDRKRRARLVAKRAARAYRGL